MKPAYSILMFHLPIFLFVLLFSSLSFAQRLNLVTSLDPIEAKEYISAFEKETKIEVRMIRLSAGEVLARLRAEKNNPTQSVWFGGPSLDYAAAQKEKLLQAYRSEATEKIPAEFREAKGFWTGIYFGSIAFVTYTPFLRREKLAPPTSWNDLLKPPYELEIAVSFPYTSGTGFTIWAGLVSLMGEEKALDYWKKLDRNIRHYSKSGSGPVLEVALGEAGAGIAFSQDIWRKALSKGFPAMISYPKEGTPYEIGAVALIAGGKEIEAGKKFIDWISSPAGQNLMHAQGRYPLLPTAKMPEGLGGGPKDVKLIQMDPQMGLKREALIDRWRSLIRK